MTSKAEKLLEQMRNSKTGWKRADLDKLYKGFGFVIKHGSNHDIMKHPDFPELRATLPRHRELARGYVEFAVKLIDRLNELQKGNEPK
jgi:predicted RNA binding protein YcfA (HicA-like mRNA interferase family)